MAHPTKPGTLVALLLVLLQLLNGVRAHAKLHKFDPQFDYLILAQFWPPSSCYIFDGPKKCDGIPEGVKGFTLHGLWPSIPGTMTPVYCDNSTRFDYNKIASLGDKLEVQWPDYVTKEEKGLWIHEWKKHGTCAVGLPALKGEFNYFDKTLKLHGTLDLLGALEKHGIEPSSTKRFPPRDFYNAILAEFKVKPVIMCNYSPKELHYFDQVYMCYNKDFTLKDCPYHSFYNECPNPSYPQLLFLPFKEQNDARLHQNELIFESEWKEEVINVGV